MTNKLEFRENYELRAVDSEEGKMIIEGVVNQIGEWSKVLYGSFREKIEPKVFERAIINRHKKRPSTFRIVRPVNGQFFGIQLLCSVR